MKIEIYFLNSKLTTEIKKDIQVKDLINELKQYLDTKDSNFILFDDEHNQLKESETISIKNQKLSKLYLIKTTINKNNLINPPAKDNLNINQLIKECTGAKKILEKAPVNQHGRINILEIIGDRNNAQGRDYFDRLINFIELFDGNNPIIIRESGNNNNNNTQVEADEQSLRQLQDMGFPEDRARQALINTRNDINRATELLLGEEAE
jgi:uncharacterized UBP type Zn finger protein